MDINIELKSGEIIKTTTDKDLQELALNASNEEFLITDNKVIRASLINQIEKKESVKVDLKSISTEDLVNALVGRKTTYSEMYHIQKLLNPSVLCGNREGE